eukprot:scpid59519/ scgid17005/ 
MDPNQSLDTLVKQLNRKPKSASGGQGSKQTKGATGGKAGPRKAGQNAAGNRANSAKAVKSRQGQQQVRQQQSRQQQGRQQQGRQQKMVGGRPVKQPVLKLKRRQPSAGILSRLGDNGSPSSVTSPVRTKGRPQTTAKRPSAGVTSKTQLAKHVEQVVQQRRMKELGNPRVKLQRRKLTNQQAQAVQSSSSQLRRPGQRQSAGNSNLLTVKIKNSKTKAQQYAARRSLARARANASGSSGILANEPIVVDPPSRPLTIQVDNDLPAQQPSTIVGVRPQPSSSIDVDLFRDAHSVAILQTSIRQNIITPAPIQGMGVDISRPAIASLPAPAGTLHARFAELPHPSRAAAVKPKTQNTSSASSASRGRTILG